jgi:DNA-binding NarL/FixJ family response regulator
LLLENKITVTAKDQNEKKTAESFAGDRGQKLKTSIKVVLVDDHPIVRRGIREVLENDGHIKVVGEASSADEAMKLIVKDAPDLVVVDIIIEGTCNGIDLIKAISSRQPSVKCLVMSMHGESIYAERSIRAGARGYIMKDIAPKNIIEAVETVMRGDLYLEVGLMKNLVDKLLVRSGEPSGEPSNISIDILSNRELDVFRLFGTGFSIREIAKKLNLSIHTVECHRRNIKKKLRLSSSTDLLKHAIQWLISFSK